VRDIHIFQAAPQIPRVQRQADYSAQQWYALSPAQAKGKVGIHWHKPRINFGIILPVPDEQICLHRLPAHVS
jgi:hypothetical protein